MSPATHTPIGARLSFPRVSGDEPVFSTSRAICSMFSPRERG